LSYGNAFSNKPFERASKTAHTQIINDPDVKSFISSCHLPPLLGEIDKNDLKLNTLSDIASKPIKHYFAIDGGYSNVVVRPQFPSATFAFFQFGALYFSGKDLAELEQKPFIDPSDMSKLQQIERFKLQIPTKGITLKTENGLISSVRKSIHDFFISKPERQSSFASALKWLVFEEFDKSTSVDTWKLSSCPSCGEGVHIEKSSLGTNYKALCPVCNADVFLTDIFRLHEAIDNELGAGGILGYLTTTVEQIIVAYLIKQMLTTKSDLLGEVLFIKDGPLAFFGQTANMHKPMRKLIGYLQANYNIFLAGVEKSGAFVEHAAQMSHNFSSGQYMVLGNKYIYKYIIPGKSEIDKPYASTTYYGHKVIFKSEDGNMYVVTIPCQDLLVEPQPSDLKNLEVILRNVSTLKCDLYSSSLMPIVLVNKLVSLASHPSSDLLRTFTQATLG